MSGCMIIYTRRHVPDDLGRGGGRLFSLFYGHKYELRLYVWTGRKQYKYPFEFQFRKNTRHVVYHSGKPHTFGSPYVVHRWPRVIVI